MPNDFDSGFLVGLAFGFVASWLAICVSWWSNFRRNRIGSHPATTDATPFHYRVDIMMRLSADELARLSEAASTHYDDRCKQAAAVGGFIYGWNQMMDVEEEESEFLVTTDRLDTAIKCCENGQRDLRKKFSNAFELCRHEYRRLNC